MGKLLARTWNANEAGTLWECNWYYDDDKGYHANSFGPGFDNPTRYYPNEKSFWKHFREQKRRFNGRVIDNIAKEIRGE